MSKELIEAKAKALYTNRVYITNELSCEKYLEDGVRIYGVCQGNHKDFVLAVFLHKSGEYSYGELPLKEVRDKLTQEKIDDSLKQKAAVSGGLRG